VNSGGTKCLATPARVFGYNGDRGFSSPVSAADDAGRPFDQLFAAGAQALLSGTQQRQAPPVENGPRWGMGVVMRPDRPAARAIGHVAAAAVAMIGTHYWLAGDASRSHLTLRVLEPYRARVAASDPRVTRYAAALRTAVRGIGPIRFTVTGLTLTPKSVMARATPAGTAADDLADAFGAALGADGRYRPRPDIWYVNLAYFTGPVRHAQDLIDWVAARRDLRVADVLVTDIQIARWRYTSTGMVPVVLNSTAPPGTTRLMRPSDL
jgi:hypothetical protein